jgi:Helix-turn-helix domain
VTNKELDKNAARGLAIIRHAREVTGNVAKTCRYYGISQQVFYTWLRRYEAEGPAGLRDRSTRPAHWPPYARPALGQPRSLAAPHAGLCLMQPKARGGAPGTWYPCLASPQGTERPRCVSFDSRCTWYRLEPYARWLRPIPGLAKGPLTTQQRSTR